MHGMMESIMNDPRIGAALDRPETAPATKSLPMLVQAFQYSRRTMFGRSLSLALSITTMGCIQTDRLYPGDSSGAPIPSFAPVVQEVMPAVVNVSAVQRVNKAAADQRDPTVGTGESRVALRGVPPSELDE